jgi:hypothetical protein
VVPQSLPNLTIKLPTPPPPPLRGLDWSKPWAIKPVPPQPQPNLTLLLPPPPVIIIGVPALCYAKDIPVRLFTAEDIAAAAAKSADIWAATFKADDIAAVSAQARDIRAFKGNANQSADNLRFYNTNVRFPGGPVIVSISPAIGPPGTVITISGSGFTGTTLVTIGGKSAAFTVISDTVLIVTVP